MPRDGSGVYSADWVNAAPNTTIESSKQNAMVADLVTDANAARPITAGGTASTTASGARTALAVPGLAVANTFTASQTITPTSGANYLTIGSGGANTLDRGILFHNQAGAAAAVIATVPNTVGTDAVMQFYVGGSAGGDVKVTIDDAGLVSLLGGQLKFPATQVPSSDANTLDDYEEGTFTPGKSGFTETGGGTITLTGFYTKIGRLVTVQIVMVPSGGASVEGVAGTSTFSGLPFAAARPGPATWINQTTEAQSGNAVARNSVMVMTSNWTSSGDTRSFQATYEV